MDIPAPIQTPSTSKLPTILLVISALGLFITTCLLAYQSWNLQQQIVNLQTKPSPEVLPSPSISPVIVVDPFSGWAEYIDLKISIQFKYPSNLTMKNIGNGVVSFIESESNQKFSFNGFKNMTADEYRNYLVQRKKNNNLQNQESFVDSKRRTWQTDMSLGEVYNFTAVLNQHDRYLVLSLQSGFDQESDGGKTFRTFANQVLSTFKYLDQINTSDTPNWKVYLGSKLVSDNKTFTFRYPSNWSVDKNNPNILRFIDQNGKTGSVHLNPGGRGGMTLEEPTRREVIEYPSGKVEIYEGKIPGQQVMDGTYGFLAKPIINGKEAPEQPVLSFEVYYQVAYIKEFRSVFDKVLKTVKFIE